MDELVVGEGRAPAREAVQMARDRPAAGELLGAVVGRRQLVRQRRQPVLGHDVTNDGVAVLGEIFFEVLQIND